VRARQSYRITPAGRRVLEALRRDISQLYSEVVAGLEPRHRDVLAREPGSDHRSIGGERHLSAARRSLSRKRP
jgi:DNA-binding PadR family transcriptional regulator